MRRRSSWFRRGVALTDDVLDQSMDVAGYPIRIHPPTASRPYHQIVYRV
ncbi:MAG: hypothetical protein QG597_5266, partial [Actinomycetota bacterium]|nr:hypothetical protein [Actinomycetota bacterium]